MKNFMMSRLGLVVGRRALEGDEAGLASDLGAINRYALRPLTAADVAVFEIEVCHDQVDAHFSRFPREELETIARLLPGRPLMELHDLQNRMPLGKIFKSWLSPEMEKVTVRADVFILRTDENGDAIENIEGGVWAETSIGFAFRMPECSICGGDLRMCDHVPGREYEGVVCFYWMRDVVEVIEVSLVPSGSQGTEVIGARARGDCGETGCGICAVKGKCVKEISDCRLSIVDCRFGEEDLAVRRRRLKLSGRRWPGWAIGE